MNKSPYESGWLAVVKISDLKEKANLMDARKYNEYVESISK